ncbi:hypothetical protein CDO52_02625 [Nocardiopsis gilva YIM 90087]|uniref:Uncharacterized protein n=1 Tax=Nocardiopsis gilva YIM 90087 TaxID=1235441 RepID=A0A223S133_9ACTN|nr:hypothetical protein CDO52_02625 [Nocardiopsis gilva YIM 90087]
MALVPVVLMAAIPSVIALFYQSRIAEQMFKGVVLVSVLMAIAIGGTTMVALANHPRSAALQRQAATESAAISGLFGTYATLHVVSLIDTPAPADISWFGLSEAPGWFWLPGIAVAAAVAALAGALGRTEALPVATEAPPVGAPTLRLAPRQKAMFAATTWLRSNLQMGAPLLAVGLALAVAGVRDGQALVPGLLFVALGFLKIGQAHARLLIDDRGATLVIAGLVRSTVPYQHISQADALAASPPTTSFPPSGSDCGWGASTGRGPALGLRLTDGRAFVFSTGKAEMAAALVNGYLHRERNHADHD